MRARDLMQAVTAAHLDDEAVAAFRQLRADDVPGLVVATGARFLVIPASQLLRGVLPRYVLDDPALGRLWDEASADRLVDRLTGLTVRDLVAALHPDEARPAPVVDDDATAVEVAAVIAAAHVPMVAVVRDGTLLGVVTAGRLIADLSR